MASHQPHVGRTLSLLPVVVVIVVVAVAGRSLWFYSDDWNIYTGYSTGNLLEPFNGHLSLVPVALYQLAFHILGVGSSWPYRAWGLVGLALLGYQIVRLTGARVGWWAAGFAVTAVLWNEAGNTNLMFPFLMNFSIPLAALLATWWHLDRATDPDEAGRSGTRHEVGASVWLAVALATSGLGIMAMGAVGVELVISRAPVRRWLILAPGPVLWAAWFLTHRDSSEVSTDIGAVISYAARMLLGGTTSLAAGWQPGGVVLLVLLASFIAVAGLRWRSLDARSLAALAAPLLFIAFTALTRLTITPRIVPDELRYRWTIAAYLVMAVVMMWRPSDADRATLRRTAPFAGAAVAVVLAVGAVRLGDGISDWVDQVEAAIPGLRSSTFATEAVGTERVDPNIVLPLSFVVIRTGEYLDAVDDIGSPIDGMDPSTFRGNEDQNRIADRLLVGQLPVSDAASSAPCRPGAAPSGSVTAPPGSTVSVRTPGPGAEVEIARFGDPPDGPVLALAAGDSTIMIPADDRSVRDAGKDLGYRIPIPPGTFVCR